MSKSARTSAGHNKAVGLPQIAQTTHIPTAAVARKSRGSSDSVISVNKYLQVRSPHQASLPEENEEEGEKEMEETEIKPDSFPYHQTSRTTTLSSTSGEIVQLLPESREPSNSFHNAVEFNTPNSASMKLAAMQEQLMTLDSSQKEKLLSNKAHTLGLTSRSWAKTAKAKRILGNHTTERAHGEVTTPQHQSYIKQEETSYRQSLNSRPHTRMAGAVRNETRTTMKDHSTNSTTRRRQEQSEPAPGVERDREGGSRRAHGDHTQKASAKQSESSKRREEDRKKLEQLRGIYDSSRNNRNHVYSRCPTRQASRCAKTRPATRASTSGWEEGTKKCQPKANRSRPVTQLGRSRGRAFIKDVTDLQLEQQRLDESCCWNEIPQKTNFRSETRPVQSSKPLDFDLDNIMLRARHRNQSGVAMVTVRLRNHKQSRRPADGAIVPGASPREIAEHTARANRRFNGLLRVQKPLAPT